MFISFGSGMIVAFILGFVLIFKLIPYRLKFSREVGNIVAYTFSVYIAGILEMLPSAIMGLNL